MCFTPSQIDRRLRRTFPRLAKEGYRITSPYREAYNCVALAVACDEEAFWEPSWRDGKMWLADAPLTDHVSAFVRLFELLNYKPCDDAGIEIAFEKIAIYRDEDEGFTHVAVQTASGAWWSKLGAWEDIEHDTLTGLCGKPPAYGAIHCIMRRPR